MGMVNTEDEYDEEEEAVADVWTYLSSSSCFACSSLDLYCESISKDPGTLTMYIPEHRIIRQGSTLERPSCRAFRAETVELWYRYLLLGNSALGRMWGEETKVICLIRHRPEVFFLLHYVHMYVHVLTHTSK
jgi:hypothetical protein